MEKSDKELAAIWKSHAEYLAVLWLKHDHSYTNECGYTRNEVKYGDALAEDIVHSCGRGPEDIRAEMGL